MPVASTTRLALLKHRVSQKTFLTRLSCFQTKDNKLASGARLLEGHSSWSETVGLVRCIGTPFVEHSKTRRPDETGVPFERLLNRAILNKMPLLFYDTVNQVLREEGNPSRPHLDTIGAIENRYSLAISLVKDIFQDARAQQIRWVLFKTRRSFRYISADIDFLLLENTDLASADKLLTERRGAKFLLIGPNSATFLDPVAEMNIDIYGRISVSYLQYINKDKLKSRNYLQETIDFGGQPVPSLDSLADTLVIAAHSVFKEQMYTLADFYTMTDAIAKMSPEKLDDFVSLVHSQKCNLAVRILLELTNILHRLAFSSPDVSQLQRLREKIKLNPIERVVESYVLAKFVRGSVKTPYKMDRFLSYLS